MEAWRAKLSAGDTAGAWDSFIGRYRQLIFAVIRRTLGDDDDVDDVFAEVCADLSRDNLALVARHSDAGKARFSTWLVTVVHHKAIDWIRHRDGRRRVIDPEGLSPLQLQIFQCLARDHRSHVEAYEIVRQKTGMQMSFGAFIREIASTYDHIEKTSGTSLARYFPGPPEDIKQEAVDPHDRFVSLENSERLEDAMRLLDPSERLAVQLFVVDELGAAEVATIVGWPNAKTVYNRVFRALAVLRRRMKQDNDDDKS